jgi:hypothetical protein
MKGGLAYVELTKLPVINTNGYGIEELMEGQAQVKADAFRRKFPVFEVW